MIEKTTKTLLLVEDEALIAMVEKSHLEKYGYRVITAGTGELAVDLACDGQGIDLVLMDINLGPGMDGTEAAGRILARKDIPVIFLSSHTEHDVVDRTENISCYGYVVKSSSITVLDASIKMAFKLFDAKRDIRLSEDARWKEVADSETRYRRLFECAQDGILILDAESGRIVDVNPFLIEMMGYGKDEFVGKAIWEIGFLRDIVASKENFLELQEREYVRYEDLPLETAQGLKLDVEFISNVYLVKDQKVIQCNIREISARKRSESKINASELRFRRLFETTQTGILILDATTGMIRDVNPYLIDMLGYSKEEFVEKAIWEIGFFRDIVASKENFLELQAKEYVRYEDLPLETAGGKTIDAEFISNVYEVDGRKVIQCNIRDISERVRAEAALEKLSGEREELYRELQHRVANSFSLISSMIGLALSEVDSPETAAVLADVDARVRSVSELYSLLHSSGSFKEVRLDEYCGKLASAIIGLSNNVSLVSDMERLTVSAKQAAPLGLILTELLTNSLKYAFPSGRTGTVRLMLRSVPAGLRLEVGDDGIGSGKGDAPAKSPGIGLKLIKALTGQIGGDFSMAMDESGTRCILECPVGIET